MSDTIIKVEGLSKAYRIGLKEQQHDTLGATIASWMKYPVRNFRRVKSLGDITSNSQGADIFWALKDVSFEVKQGEVLGIIGRNGAGKSTLLKILSRITEPTAGRVKIRGRVASLLEVGTGFNPELTGRENVYLNGTILGMTKKEIDAKFDEIIDFSGIEKFIDTPVKRYSSGMKVRLAFSVAAHLDPEILVIDEVLAVGDAEFQKKCLGKMGEINKGQGRTVLFVSHNMAAVKSLCTRGLVIEKGVIKMVGDVENVVSYYLSGDSDVRNKRTFGLNYDKLIFRLDNIFLANKGKTYDQPIKDNLPICLHTKLFLKTENPERYGITYHLYNEMGEALFSFTSGLGTLTLKRGGNELVCTFPASFFQSGQYFLSLYIVEDNRQTIFVEKDIISFTIVDGGREFGVYMGREPGYIKPQFEWFNICEK